MRMGAKYSALGHSPPSASKKPRFDSAASQRTALEVRKRLGAAYRFADITCEYDSGAVVLHGHVSGFYRKQMAQEAARRVEGVVTIINEIEVVTRNELAQTEGRRRGPIDQ